MMLAQPFVIDELCKIILWQNVKILQIIGLQNQPMQPVQHRPGY